MSQTIPTGPYAGLVGLITQYTMTSTARTATGGEVRMQRTLQTVAVPVFQFGIFSETDLSFFAGAEFQLWRQGQYKRQPLSGRRQTGAL